MKKYFILSIFYLIIIVVAYLPISTEVKAAESLYTGEATLQMVVDGRKIIDSYRVTSRLLGLKPTEHTPFIGKMEADLKALGFNAKGDGVNTFSVWDEFNTASELLNVKELGFTSFADYEKRANLKAQRDLDAKWH